MALHPGGDAHNLRGRSRCRLRRAPHLQDCPFARLFMRSACIGCLYVHMHACRMAPPSAQPAELHDCISAQSRCCNDASRTPAIQHDHQQRRLLGGRLDCAVRLQRPLVIATIRHSLIGRRRRDHCNATLVIQTASGNMVNGPVHYQVVQLGTLIGYAARYVLKHINEATPLLSPDTDLLSESEMSCMQRFVCSCHTGTDLSLACTGQKPPRGLILATVCSRRSSAYCRSWPADNNRRCTQGLIRRCRLCNA